MSLQLVVKTDKEIKHLIRKFVGFVKHHKRVFLAFERVDDVVHHIRHRAAREVHAHTLQQLAHERAAVPIFRAAEVVNMAVRSGVVLYGFRLTTTSVTRNGQHKAVLTGIVKQKAHAAVRACFSDAPRFCLVPRLGGYRAPHFLADGVPITCQHLADSGRAYAVHTVGRLVLAAFLHAVVFKTCGNLLFFVLLHLISF